MSLVTVETTSTLETILTFAGPLIGVGIGIWASNRTAAAADRRAQRVENARALANYMAAAELVATELASFPEDSALERLIDRQLPPPRRIGSLFQRMMERAAFGKRHDDLRRQYQQAKAEVVLVSPIEIISLVNQVDEFLVRWINERGEHMTRDWMTLSDALRLIAQNTVDEGRGRPYRAGELPMNARPQPTRREIVARRAYELISGRAGRS